MNDMKQSGVKLELDKERTLLFDLNAFCELEDHFGSLQTALSELNNMSFKAIRKLLHAALVHEDEALTEKKVGALINMDNISDISAKLMDAFSISSPEPDEKNV